jgi:cytochrome P450 PksS
LSAAPAVTDLSQPIMFSDPHPHLARLRKVAPVSRVKSQLTPRGAWLLTRYDDVVALHTDARFSSDGQKHAGIPLMRWAPRPLLLLTDSMVFKDDPEHKRLRSLVNKAFTPNVIQRLAPDVERFTHELLDCMARERVADLVSSYALPLPLAIISEMLGVTARDRERFHGWVARFLDAPAGGPWSLLLALPTAYKLVGLFRDLADLRRSEPDDRLITSLLRASDGEDRLTEHELLAMIFLLLLAGHETTANLIGNGTLALLEHPEQLALLRAQPELIDSAVEELLRFTSPVVCGAPRIALEDVEIAGVVIPKGSQVLGMLASANRDATKFIEPDRLDIRRDPNRHLAFGLGIHFCLGTQLARLEAKIALGALIQRFPELSLAVPRAELRWKATESLRGLRSLPLRLAG